ncbi:MAG: hypothetical protein J0I13_01450 [Rhizobiales bacterium]|nr:hypothetical protein [Hyphomicrobiales bacterium]
MNAVAADCNLCDPCRAGGPGVDDIHALGRRKPPQRGRVGTPVAQVESCGHERQPLAAEALKFLDQFAALAGNDRAGADLDQRACNVDGRAGLGRIAKRRDDLQHGRPCKRARQHARLGDVFSAGRHCLVRSCSIMTLSFGPPLVFSFPIFSFPVLSCTR